MTGEEALKERCYQAACITTFTSVFAHCINIQSETILFRNACRGDLAKAAKALSLCNALAGILGIVINQLGGKLSDSLGRKLFFTLGPLAQITSGILSCTFPGQVALLQFSKTLRLIFTTFSGTVMGTALMRDSFQGQELAVKSSKIGAVIGLAIMTAPTVEGALLKRLSGRERFTFLALIAAGLAGLTASLTILPESLKKEKRTKFDLMNALSGSNPFGFLQIYRKGSPALQKMVTIVSLQTMIDGKNMSDLGQIWMREHLKMSMEGIRNFIVGFGTCCTVAGMKVTPALLKNLSMEAFTNLTNFTNFVAFSMRGAVESTALYIAAIPFMLPGVNGSSGTALSAVVNDQMKAAGFGIGESTAWLNNLRVFAGVVATLIYGNVYAWLVKRGTNPGLTYLVAGIVGAAIPQAIFSLTLKSSDYREVKPKVTVAEK
mmetsp:Transcript_23592/g.42627  ORF Transcript_23592/g.42627 Transcript_23592/m.42627 type:complete len:434 (-) Transcript_23592:78-1379(-)